MIYAAAILVTPTPCVTLELIFSHLVSVESIWNVAPLVITSFAFRNHTPAGDCFVKIVLSWTLLSISVNLAEEQLTVMVLVDGL